MAGVTPVCRCSAATVASSVATNTSRRFTSRGLAGNTACVTAPIFSLYLRRRGTCPAVQGISNRKYALGNSLRVPWGV